MCLEYRITTYSVSFHGQPVGLSSVCLSVSSTGWLDSPCGCRNTSTTPQCRARYGGFTPTPSDAEVQHSGRRAGLLSTRVFCSAGWVLSRSWAPVAVIKHGPPFPFFNSRLMWRDFDCVFCHFFPFAPHLQKHAAKTEKKGCLWNNVFTAANSSYCKSLSSECMSSSSSLSMQ